MKVMMPFLSTLLLSPLAFAHTLNDTTPVQYDYAFAKVTSGTYRNDGISGENVSSFDIGLSHKFSQSNLLWNADYGAHFIHIDPVTTELYQLRVGLGYRWFLADNLDLVSNGKIGALRVSADRKETDFLYSVDVGLRYAVTKKIEAGVFAEALRNKWADENVYTVRGDYYFYPKFSLGAFYSYRDVEDNAYIREAGIAARFNY